MARRGTTAESRRAEPEGVRVPGGAPRWVTEELIAHTIRYWQQYTEKPLTSDDALEILLNTGRLVEYLISDRERENG